MPNRDFARVRSLRGYRRRAASARGPGWQLDPHAQAWGQMNGHPRGRKPPGQNPAYRPSAFLRAFNRRAVACPGTLGTGHHAAIAIRFIGSGRATAWRGALAAFACARGRNRAFSGMGLCAGRLGAGGHVVWLGRAAGLGGSAIAGAWPVGAVAGNAADPA